MPATSAARIRARRAGKKNRSEPTPLEEIIKTNSRSIVDGLPKYESKIHKQLRVLKSARILTLECLAQSESPLNPISSSIPDIIREALKMHRFDEAIGEAIRSAKMLDRVVKDGRIDRDFHEKFAYACVLNENMTILVIAKIREAMRNPLFGVNVGRMSRLKGSYEDVKADLIPFLTKKELVDEPDAGFVVQFLVSSLSRVIYLIETLSRCPTLGIHRSRICPSPPTTHTKDSEPAMPPNGESSMNQAKLQRNRPYLYPPRRSSRRSEDIPSIDGYRTTPITVEQRAALSGDPGVHGSLQTEKLSQISNPSIVPHCPSQGARQKHELQDLELQRDILDEFLVCLDEIHLTFQRLAKKGCAHRLGLFRDVRGMNTIRSRSGCSQFDIDSSRILRDYLDADESEKSCPTSRTSVWDSSDSCEAITLVWTELRKLINRVVAHLKETRSLIEELDWFVEHGNSLANEILKKLFEAEKHAREIDDRHREGGQVVKHSFKGTQGYPFVHYDTTSPIRQPWQACRGLYLDHI